MGGVEKNYSRKEKKLKSDNTKKAKNEQKDYQKRDTSDDKP